MPSYAWCKFHRYYLKKLCYYKASFVNDTFYLHDAALVCEGTYFDLETQDEAIAQRPDFSLTPVVKQILKLMVKPGERGGEIKKEDASSFDKTLWAKKKKFRKIKEGC